VLTITLITMALALWSSEQEREPTAEDLYRWIKKRAAILGDRLFLTWLNQNKDQVISEIWQQLPTPAGTLWERFHAKAVLPGIRGYRAALELPPGAFDDRDPLELADTMITRALHLGEDPDFIVLYQEWEAGIGDDPGEELAEYLMLPSRDKLGEPLSPFARDIMLDTVLDLAAEAQEAWWGTSSLEIDPRYEVRGEKPREIIKTPRGPKPGVRPVSEGYGPMPLWAVVALLADSLTPSDEDLRLVNVDRDTAKAFIARYHAKLPEWPYRTMYAIGAKLGGRLVAVATAGHPTGRWADQQNVLELTRVASDGTMKNAASMLTARILDLLSASKRGDPGQPARFVTYSLSSEEGSTYRALADKGLRPVVFLASTKHLRPTGRRKTQKSLAGVDKIRWEAGPGAGTADWDLLELVGESARKTQAAQPGFKPHPDGQGWLLGYRVMRWDPERGMAVSGQDARQAFELDLVGVHRAQPGKGFFLTDKGSYALDHYLVHDDNVLLTYVFHPDHVVSGSLDDLEPEISVSEAVLLDAVRLDGERNRVAW